MTNRTNIKISVLCAAYNQELYIEDALIGFVKQKTDFPFEVIVHDDASTDGTQDIIREYEHKYPDIIHGVYESENQYSKNVNIVDDILFPIAKGEYIALCEGDDFWIDPYKLQKQYNALDTYKDCDMCACSAITINANNRNVVGKICPQKHNGIIRVEKVIEGGGGYVATAGLVYRKEILERSYAFRNSYKLDYTLQIMGSLRGGLVYIADDMAVYRVLSSSSWTKRVKEHPDELIENNNNIIRSLNVLDQETNGIYKKSINIAIEKIKFMSLTAQKKYLETFKVCKSYIRTIPILQRVKIYLSLFFPWLHTLNEKRRSFHSETIDMKLEENNN